MSKPDGTAEHTQDDQPTSQPEGTAEHKPATKPQPKGKATRKAAGKPENYMGCPLDGTGLEGARATHLDIGSPSHRAERTSGPICLHEGTRRSRCHSFLDHNMDRCAEREMQGRIVLQ